MFNNNENTVLCDCFATGPSPSHSLESLIANLIFTFSKIKSSASLALFKVSTRTPLIPS